MCCFMLFGFSIRFDLLFVLFWLLIDLSDCLVGLIGDFSLSAGLFCLTIVYLLVTCLCFGLFALAFVLLWLLVGLV